MYKLRLSSFSSLDAAWRDILIVTLLVGLSACSAVPAVNGNPNEPSDPSLAELEVASPTRSELIFSAVKGTESEPQTVTLKNVGTGPLELSALIFSGTDAASFAATAPMLPFRLEAGASQDITVMFVPDSAGTRSATLEVQSAGSGSLSLDLYGLGSDGEQGSLEPSLHNVVTTLGYDVDVGGSNLELGRIAGSIGDEVIAPLFERASDGPVTLTVVARYGPNAVLPYGYFSADADTSSAEDVVLSEVGTVAAEHAQLLLPPVATGGTSFDPGIEPFGIYGEAGGATQYTVDDLNTGEIAHALRVYPLKDRTGQSVPNSYLIGLEEASNGDYQDVLFVLTNVVPLSDEDSSE